MTASKGSSTDSLVSMQGISKAFGPVQALMDVDLTLLPGEIHTLAGENGSGKSTLMRILGGVLRPDAGHIEVDGSRREFHNVRAAMHAGVTIVSQELSLVPALSVAENVFLGHQQVRDVQGISWKKTNAACRRLIKRLDLDVDPGAPVESLPQDKQQLIEIARALAFDSRVILLDEATSSLEPAEVATLFGVMRQLRDDGVAIVFISHRMREMKAISDRYTVLRDGRLIDTAPADDVDSDWLIERMVVQRPARAAASAATLETAHSGRAVVRVEHLSDRDGRVDDLSLTLHAGEVVGLAGLAGAGRTEFVETLVGYRSRKSGTVTVLNEQVSPSTRTSVRAGIALVPDDRRTKSAVLDMSVRDNLLLSYRGGRGGSRSKANEAAIVHEWVDKLRIKTADIDSPLRSLSGGNQQKVIIARCLQMSPKLLILDEPTRGIDLGAKRRSTRSSVTLRPTG